MMLNFVFGCALTRELNYNIPTLILADPPNTQVNDIVRSPCAFLRFFEQVKQIGNILQRGQKVDYDLWAAQSPEYKIWDYNHCLETFKAVKNIAHKVLMKNLKLSWVQCGVRQNANGRDDVAKFVAVNVKLLDIIGMKIKMKYLYDGRVHESFIAPKGEVIICGDTIIKKNLE
ncbi:unnamed protein product [Rhizophagus irregularis]|nr:unnamed protein product [Rhizophagus irregularis]CAB4428596.1 unnamed protein product [Rhizophagus irregularis]